MKNVLITVLAVIILTTLIATNVRQQFTETNKRSNNKLYKENPFDWKRHVGKQMLSKFNVTMHMVRRLGGALSNRLGKQHGYVVALQFSGQQGAGIQALMSLQCWAASFGLPIRILEPLISSTMFASFVSPRHQNSTFLKFGDMFDLEHFNKISESSLNYAQLGTREDFFADAPKDIIFVSMDLIPKNASKKERIPKVVWTSDSESKGDEYCYQFEDMNGYLRQLFKENFCVVRIIKAAHSLTSSYIFADKQLWKIIYGDRLPQHVTLIFSKWRTSWFMPNNEAKDPNMCKHSGYRSSKEQFIPSPRLIADAEYYEKNFLSSHNEVALMLRIEHMMMFISESEHSPNVWTVDKCLVEVFRLMKGMRLTGYPMVTLDMGKFGSSSLEATTGSKDTLTKLTEKTKVLLTSLFDNKLTFEEWEDSFTKATRGVEHHGYIAALQRTLASRAKCLVLVGGGSFQDLALKNYIMNHPNKADHCIELVCNRKEESFTKIINGQK